MIKTNHHDSGNPTGPKKIGKQLIDRPKRFFSYVIPESLLQAREIKTTRKINPIWHWNSCDNNYLLIFSCLIDFFVFNYFFVFLRYHYFFSYFIDFFVCIDFLWFGVFLRDFSTCRPTTPISCINSRVFIPLNVWYTHSTSEVTCFDIGIRLHTLNQIFDSNNPFSFRIFLFAS